MKKKLLIIALLFLMNIGCANDKELITETPITTEESISNEKVDKETFIGTWVSEDFAYSRCFEISEENGKMKMLSRVGGNVEINNTKDKLTIITSAHEEGMTCTEIYERESSLNTENPYLGVWYRYINSSNEKIKISEKKDGVLNYEILEDDKYVESNYIKELYWVKKADVVIVVESQEEEYGVLKDNYILFDGDDDYKLYYFSKYNKIEYIKNGSNPIEVIQNSGGLEKVE